jgi:hypothetical protein
MDSAWADEILCFSVAFSLAGATACIKGSTVTPLPCFCLRGDVRELIDVSGFFFKLVDVERPESLVRCSPISPMTLVIAPCWCRAR